MNSETKHEVGLTNHFRRGFKALDRNMQERIWNKILELANGNIQGKKLRGKYRGRLSLRVGMYRIIYGIPKYCKIELYDVGPRETIYKWRKK